MEPINEYNMVQRELKRKLLDTRQVAARLGLRYQTAYSMMQRKKYSVEEISHFSKVLEYNFFAELATQFNFAEPVDPEKAALNERIKELETEVALLRRTFKDLMGK